MEVQTILTEIKKLCSGIEESTLEYMSEMISAEECTSSQHINTLISPFLIDACVCDNEIQSLYLCNQLFQTLQTNVGGGIKNDNNNNNTHVSGLLSAPVKMNDILSLQQVAYSDPFLGLRKVETNTNNLPDYEETLKQKKLQVRERDRQMKLMRDWQKSKQPLPPPKKKHIGTYQSSKLTDIVVPHVCVSIAGKQLLIDAPLKLVLNRTYGLVGRNGIGKSTFLSALARYDVPGVPHDIQFLHIEQELQCDDCSAVDSVLSVDIERTSLMEELQSLQSEDLQTMTESERNANGSRCAWIMERLDLIGAHTAQAKASEILSGLGFTSSMQKKATNLFSGGWRMRVVLARALFACPDILLLDEPTNHLDLHAVAWLTDYLTNYNKTCIIVSHAREFLNEVCEEIIHFENSTLTYYKGDYDNFETVRSERRRAHTKAVESQTAKKEHMQAFINKFRYNAKRAALVQSRIKALNKLPSIESLSSDPTLSFLFKQPEPIPSPMLSLSGVSFRYSDDTPIIVKDVDLSVDLDSRIAICGVNGSGKSTLLQLLLGSLEPTEGFITRHNKLRIGFFSQHHNESLDLTLNSVQQLQMQYPNDDISDEAARNYLGGFGISGMLALEPLYVLSGGQKSRVCVALMGFKEPHIMLLDEPTNHLDIEGVEALVCALCDYKGGIVVISHDSHTISCLCEDFYHIDPSKASCNKFCGDFDDYKASIVKKKL
eukprot:GHVR01132328.1.p1 GENE.GHVR01132328.1~~GHVR01132328.1.p1  ORF type:complete len:716 (+),score=149.31 GHVR01132328.1:116-2263(+)